MARAEVSRDSERKRWRVGANQYAMLRPNRLGPFLAVWTAGFVVAGVVSANDPRDGPWYLLAGPVAYAAGQ
jgi:hypothetical protein